MAYYPWPASGITEQEMALLYEARESAPKRVPITELLRRAVQEVYGRQAGEGEDSGEETPGAFRIAA